MTDILFPPPENIPLARLLPAKPLLLMGAGPVPVPAAVAAANSVVINHLGPTMNRIIERVRLMAAYAFQTTSDKILGVGGPASAAMEMALASVLSPRKAVLILSNGTFGTRFGEMAKKLQAQVTILAIDPQNPRPFTPDEVAQALKKKKYTAVAIVHGETSCGLLNIHLPAIAQLAQEHGALTIVDGVCTLSTMPLPMDQWGLDIVVTGGQKGLSSIPGVSLIAFSATAWEKAMKRKSITPHWVLDVNKAASFWIHHQYHYTAPVPGILALHEALRLLCLEGLPHRFHRHLSCSLALQSVLESWNLPMFTPVPYRLNSVVAIQLPSSIDSIAFRQRLAQVYGVEISGAFGLPLVRIGQMGEQCRQKNLHTTIWALGSNLTDFRFPVDLHQAIKIFEHRLSA